MLAFLVPRLAQAFLTLFVTMTLVFFVGHISGDPASVALPASATPAERAAYLQRFGFDRPLHEQYLTYLGGVATGDLGTSLFYRQPAIEIIFPRFLNSAKLALVSLLLTFLVAVPMGVAAAVWRGRWSERVVLTAAVIGQSVPTFVMAIVFVLVFAVWLRLLPAAGMTSWESFVLPAVVMAWFSSAGIVRLLRSSLLEEIDREYVTVARAKGLSERVILWRHALRNAAIPVTTFIGMMFGIILTSAVTAEIIFFWPGVAQLIYTSILQRDYPMTQAAVTLTAAVIVFINLSVDLIYVALDPRVRV